MIIIFMKMMLILSFMSVIFAWRNKSEKHKALKEKISKELIPVACHPTRWWDWFMREDEKK